MKLTVNQQRNRSKGRMHHSRTFHLSGTPEKGIAIAVNNRMVPRIEWEKCVLHPNDSLVVIKAACGG